MKRIRTNVLVVCLIASMLFLVPTTISKADGIGNDEDYTPFLSLGADLKESERSDVLSLMGLTQEQVDDFDVIEVTNEEEKQYLGEYLDASVIGTRALSSALIIKKEDGYGITVETHNINYCTQGMYCNALVTAGVKNAQMVVAGPFEITGTAALIGAMESYSVMMGEEITQETMDTAVNELVLTGSLAEKIGDSQKAEELMAMVKQQIVEGKLTSPEEIKLAIEDAAGELNLNLTEEQLDTIKALMEKISKLDLDADTIKEQANRIFDKLDDMGVDTDKIGTSFSNFFQELMQAIVEFFKGLF
ncbi:MAG: DUF1002 domain-containing protein [Velocimicrobium sp.]